MKSYWLSDSPSVLRYRVVTQSNLFNRYNDINKVVTHVEEEYVCEQHVSQYIQSKISNNMTNISIYPQAVSRTCGCCEPDSYSVWNSDLPGFVYTGHWQ